LRGIVDEKATGHGWCGPYLEKWQGYMTMLKGNLKNALIHPTYLSWIEVVVVGF